MKRREFIALIGGAAAWPLATRAEQPAVPVIGLLSSLAPGDQARVTLPFREGLKEAGYIEGRNVSIEYRWAEGQFDRLPVLSADLIRHRVAVIAAISGTPAALAAKAATTTIPIVFALGSDAVAFGLVASLNRPGGNITGTTFFTASLGAKRLELLRELVPRATAIALLVNLDNPASAADRTEVEAAAQSLGQQVSVLPVSTGDDIDAAFAMLARSRPGGLYVGPDPVFFIERDRLVFLAARHAIPAIYSDREIAEAGGLISYGASRIVSVAFGVVRFW